MDTLFKQLNHSAVRHTDERGHLEILYEQGQVVLKRSFSKAGVFRGMHWQRPPHAQTKLIRVISGRILDFAVNPAQEPARLYRRELIPADGWIQIDANLAHGFYALEPSEFEYLCLGAYCEEAELSYSILAFLQSELKLSQLTLSTKDQSAQPLSVVDGDQCI